MFRRASLRAAAGVLVGMLLLVACGGAEPDEGAQPTAEEEPATGATEVGGTDTTEPAGEPDLVRVAPTAPLPAYWPYYYIAEPLGFYEDENIDVEFINAQTAVQQALLAGELDIVGTGLDYIPQFPTLDDAPPFYMNLDGYLWIMITIADSGFETAEDLRGGRIGINAPHDTLDAEFLMGSAGVPQGEYELIPVGEDRAAVVAMQRGEIDAFVAAGAVSLVAVQQFFPDVEFHVIENEAAESYYNTGLMTTNDTLTNDRDLAVRFGRAVARGMVWTYENPAAAAELLLEVQPDSAEDVEQATAFIEAGNEIHRFVYDNQGRMELEVYQQMVDQYAELGFIDESYDASALFTNDLLDEIWDFDIEAEIEAARSDSR